MVKCLVLQILIYHISSRLENYDFTQHFTQHSVSMVLRQLLVNVYVVCKSIRDFSENKTVITQDVCTYKLQTFHAPVKKLKISPKAAAADLKLRKSSLGERLKNCNPI